MVYPAARSQRVGKRQPPNRARGLTKLSLTNTLLTSRTEPNFVKSICLRQGLLFHSVVTCLDSILAPVRRSFDFGDTPEGIVVESFGIGLEYANRSVSFVCQDDLCSGQGDAFGSSADPESDNPLITFRDVSLVRTGAYVGHDAVKIHWVLISLKHTSQERRKLRSSTCGFYGDVISKSTES